MQVCTKKSEKRKSKKENMYGKWNDEMVVFAVFSQRYSQMC